MYHYNRQPSCDSNEGGSKPVAFHMCRQLVLMRSEKTTLNHVRAMNSAVYAGSLRTIDNDTITAINKAIHTYSNENSTYSNENNTYSLTDDEIAKAVIINMRMGNLLPSGGVVSEGVAKEFFGEYKPVKKRAKLLKELLFVPLNNQNLSKKNEKRQKKSQRRFQDMFTFTRLRSAYRLKEVCNDAMKGIAFDSSQQNPENIAKAAKSVLGAAGEAKEAGGDGDLIEHLRNASFSVIKEIKDNNGYKPHEVFHTERPLDVNVANSKALAFERGGVHTDIVRKATIKGKEKQFPWNLNNIGDVHVVTHPGKQENTPLVTLLTTNVNGTRETSVGGVIDVFHAIQSTAGITEDNQHVQFNFAVDRAITNVYDRRAFRNIMSSWFPDIESVEMSELFDTPQEYVNKINDQNDASLRNKIRSGERPDVKIGDDGLYAIHMPQRKDSNGNTVVYAFDMVLPIASWTDRTSDIPVATLTSLAERISACKKGPRRRKIPVVNCHASVGRSNIGAVVGEFVFPVIDLIIKNPSLLLGACQSGDGDQHTKHMNAYSRIEAGDLTDGELLAISALCVTVSNNRSAKLAGDYYDGLSKDADKKAVQKLIVNAAREHIRRVKSVSEEGSFYYAPPATDDVAGGAFTSRKQLQEVYYALPPTTKASLPKIPPKPKPRRP